MGAPVPIVPTYKNVYMKFEKSEPQSLEVLAKDAARLTEGGYLIHTFLYALTALDIIGKIRNENTLYPITVNLPKGNVIIIE